MKTRVLLTAVVTMVLVSAGAAAMLLAAGPAMAATVVTGNYSVSFNDGTADASVTDNLTTTSFSLTEGAARTGFITINPGGCYSGCDPHTYDFSVTFSNLKVNGMSVAGFTEDGVYTANYSTVTDSVVWDGAGTGSFGNDQNGDPALGLVVAIGDGADINLIDGADWDVQTYIDATGAPATPLPAALPLFAGGLGFLGFLGRRRSRLDAIAA